MNKIILTIIIIFSINISISQTTNHWETAIFANDTWSYFVGTSQANSDWTNLSSNESVCLLSAGGFDDGDDRTKIATSMSVFFRKKITVTDLSKLTKTILHADFNDGFIAYINGVGIARYGKVCLTDSLL